MERAKVGYTSISQFYNTQNTSNYLGQMEELTYPDGEYNNGYVYESVLVGISNDGRDIYRLNWAIGIEEQPKARADVYQKSYEKEYQRIEYTPYGESWIELSKNIDNYLPYKFTGKELDEETGFYYYGQRYLDPRYSIWHTLDPAIYDYMSQSKEGEGGIYNVTNLNLYHYAGNNPIKYIDPDGKSAVNEVMEVGGVVTTGVEISYATFTIAELFEKYGVIGGGIMLLLLLLRGDTQPSIEINLVEVPQQFGETQAEDAKGQIKENAEVPTSESSDKSKQTTSEPDMSKPETWPKVPTDMPLQEGEPSRNKPRQRGEKSLYDSDGGECGLHKPDMFHQKQHYDYKLLNGKWEDIPISFEN